MYFIFRSGQYFLLLKGYKFPSGQQQGFVNYKYKKKQKNLNIQNGCEESGCRPSAHYCSDMHLMCFVHVHLTPPLTMTLLVLLSACVCECMSETACLCMHAQVCSQILLKWASKMREDIGP